MQAAVQHSADSLCAGATQLTLDVLLQSPTPSEASAKDAMSADGDERLWSRQPGSMSGNGLDETYRKFAAARRKYMLLYFQLLQSTGRLDTLLAGHAFLQSTAWGSPAMMMDLARWDHCAPSLATPPLVPVPIALTVVEPFQLPSNVSSRCSMVERLWGSFWQHHKSLVLSQNLASQMCGWRGQPLDAAQGADCRPQPLAA